MSSIELDFKKSPLIPTVVQDAETKDILMLAFMNEEAWEQTQATQKAHFYSRSRQKQWMKGESSGNVQEVKRMFVDCDKDAVVLMVNQVGGAACHTGRKSCFYREVIDGELVEILKPLFDPGDVYGSKK